MKFRLNVDEEFKKIAPPISRSEYAELEKSIMSEGCRDPIIIWNGVIVDGHNRYVIFRHHDIQFNIKTVYFESREEAECNRHPGKRNGASNPSMASFGMRSITEQSASTKHICPML